MGAPQWIVVGLYSLTVIMAIVNHDKPRDNYNGGTSILAAGIMATLLYWGGFFT